MYTVKGVKLPSVTASWKHILCFSVTASFTVSILLHMMKTFFENVFPILYSRKFCPEMFSFPANYCNNVVLCFCYGLITALCFAFHCQ